MRIIHKQIGYFYNHFLHNSLFRNSIYMMASSVVLSVFGFIFWIICARIYTPSNIGTATTLISITVLISNFSLAGLNQGVIRYLPKAKDKNQVVNTILHVVLTMSILLTIVYVIFIRYFSPKLEFIFNNPFFTTGFILFLAITSLNLITDSIFVAYRSAKYIFIVNIIYSVTKMILPFILLGFGLYGIFFSYAIAISVAMIMSFIFMFYRFDYRIGLAPHLGILKKLSRFSLASYAANFLGILPSMVLPIVLTNTIGAKSSAFYYIDMMIASIIYIVPTSVTQALFAEGINDKNSISHYIKSSIKITAILIIPAILVITLGGGYILRIFGKVYSSEGLLLLQMLAVSGIFIAINNITGTVFKFQDRVMLLTALNLLSAITVISLSVYFLDLKLIGIGIAWLSGYGITSIVSLYLVRRKRRIVTIKK